MKKVLILGGGRAQIGLISTAKKMGLFTIVAGIKGDYPGYALADKVFFVDVFDKKKILEIAENEGINGISMVCSEIGLETLGYVCDTLHLSGPSEKAARLSSNKLEMKTLLKSNNISTPEFKIIKTSDPIKESLNNINFPIMVKAIDLQGSKGIYKCNDFNEAFKSIKEVFNLSKQSECIIEEYIEGIEFGAQAYIYNGNFFFILPHGDEIYKHKDKNIPIGHYMPFLHDNDILISTIENTVINAVNALGFNNCAVNLDFILRNGKLYVLELSARAGANMLPELTGSYLGLNYYELILRGALRDNPVNYYITHKNLSHKVFLSRQIFFQEPSILKSIKINYLSNIISWHLYIKEGEQTNGFFSSNDCIGDVLCKGDNLLECEKTIDSFLETSINLVSLN